MEARKERDGGRERDRDTERAKAYTAHPHSDLLSPARFLSLKSVPQS